MIIPATPEVATVAIAKSGIQGGRKVWPSLETASRVSNVANVAFIGSLVVGVVATVLIVWMAGVKEAYWDADRQRSAERIVKLSHESARLAVEAETAKSKIAAANAEAARARLETEKIRERLAARLISPEQAETFRTVLQGMISSSVVVLYVANDGESRQYAEAIARALKYADVSNPMGAYPGLHGATGVGITSGKVPSDRLLLEEALTKAGIPFTEDQRASTQLSDLHILVGSKPPPF